MRFGWRKVRSPAGAKKREVADGEAREPETRGPGTAGIVAEWKEEESGEDEEDEDEEEGWRLVPKGIGECERVGAVRSMGGEEGGEGPKVTRGLRVTEVVIGRRDGAAREESGPIGVAEEGRGETGIALIVPFWRNGVSRRSQLKDLNSSIELETARELWRTM